MELFLFLLKLINLITICGHMFSHTISNVSQWMLTILADMAQQMNHNIQDNCGLFSNKLL